MNPSALRSHLRAWRAALPAVVSQDRAEQLARHLVPWLLDQRVERIGTYLAKGGELDLGPTLDNRALSGRLRAVPMLGAERLTFGVVSDETTWTSNRFGISEPESAPTIDIDDLDVVLVPCVALDRSGNRVGQGGGWYDRTFAAPGHSAVLVGIAYDEQIVETVTVESWDVPVDVIATPSGVWMAERGASA